jgi:hypothetical protein
MFRCNIFIFLILCSFGFTAVAEATHSDSPSNSWTVSFSLTSWQEAVSLQNGNTKDSATANFYGNGLVLTQEKFFGSEQLHGSLLEVGLLAGTTTVGGTQSTLTYQAANIAWWGLSLSYRYAYRLSNMLILSIGPEVLDRQISYANIAGTSAASPNSSSGLNYGALAEMRERLTERLEGYQSLGTFAANSTTLFTVWNLGFGYAF